MKERYTQPGCRHQSSMMGLIAAHPAQSQNLTCGHPHKRGVAQPKELCPLLAANLTQMHDSTLAHTYMVSLHVTCKANAVHNTTPKRLGSGFLTKQIASHTSLFLYTSLGACWVAPAVLAGFESPSSNHD